MSRTETARRRNGGTTFQGEPMVWLTGGMFAIACLMILALMALVLMQGLSTLWPRSYLLLSTSADELVGGELQNWQTYRLSRQNLNDLDPVSREAAENLLRDAAQVSAKRMYLRTGNYEITNRHFAFVPELSIASSEPWHPDGIWLLERREWGNLYGFPRSVSWTETTQSNIVSIVRTAVAEAARLTRKIEHEKELLKRIDRRLHEARIGVRQVELAERTDLQSIAEQAIAASQSSEPIGDPQPSLSARAKRAIDRLVEQTRLASEEQVAINEAIAALEAERNARSLTVQLPLPDAQQTLAIPYGSLALSNSPAPVELLQAIGWGDATEPVRVDAKPLNNRQSLLEVKRGDQPPTYLWAVASQDGSASIATLREHNILIADIVRLIEPNRLSWMGKLGVYASRWGEFLFGQPREAGVEGGFFPAIWGTIVMTLVMSLAVMPFGVLAALYMREYANSGWLLSIIRISINNLAGVPSIVYGVFGLSFFCYTIGGYIDGGPVKAGFTPWPSAVWFSALGVLAILGLIAFCLAILSQRAGPHDGSLRKFLGGASGVVWLASLVAIVWLLIKSPFFHGFYEADLPNPTFGKGCLLWAACTLALLTLPVVIVATEEALAAVPNSLREGSYACGAGKWQTIHRIVLPYARPGIITGFILAMARGAGEVAPMMLVGAIPLATELPLDLEFPFLHGSRSFMHLGFQIYSLGFQSQNSEAAKPMVFTATLLLLTIVTLLNQTAIWLRAHLRKRFQSSQF
ncbi:MAG: ABC transporter permease subunit [Pirellula sp.]|jgi:ABC-type phosphate transport system permease subunit/ABC-type phosphate transport system auxiliary subunit